MTHEEACCIFRRIRHQYSANELASEPKNEIHYAKITVKFCFFGKVILKLGCAFAACSTPAYSLPKSPAAAAPLPRVRWAWLVTGCQPVSGDGRRLGTGS